MRDFLSLLAIFSFCGSLVFFGYMLRIWIVEDENKKETLENRGGD